MRLKHTDWTILTIFLTAALSWSVIQMASPPSLRVKIWQPPIVKISNSLESIGLNSATYEELLAVPGIGPVLAQRILDYRKEHGSFKTIEELNNIKGIGPKTLEKLKPYLRINP
ncbi:helix-hairpin-helix domain-containing protein [Candidatus Acetothermia bacterium]|nr:helix-hairpin-helix domain-containing protein [Candidatus Acetothermia bacterium]MBI3460280.1 helix-hairpin-helix domain-containing protein [Candidatus Acetothermia bacterium]MBI3659762.1 helix-hairpin-helix domain-containing protein [Candidatus Acetothermia bacterium]